VSQHHNVEAFQAIMSEKCAVSSRWAWQRHIRLFPLGHAVAVAQTAAASDRTAACPASARRWPVSSNAVHSTSRARRIAQGPVHRERRRSGEWRCRGERGTSASGWRIGKAAAHRRDGGTRATAARAAEPHRSRRPVAPRRLARTTLSGAQRLTRCDSPWVSSDANLVLTLDRRRKAPCRLLRPPTRRRHCAGWLDHPPSEVAGCTGFTGADSGRRASSRRLRRACAGRGHGASNNESEQGPLTQCVNSVWHRTPLPQPLGGRWLRERRHADVIDQGPCTQCQLATSLYTVRRTDWASARSFNGANEGPMPPAPPTGWRAGCPCTLYVQNATTVSHSIEFMGSARRSPTMDRLQPVRPDADRYHGTRTSRSRRTRRTT